MAFISYRRNGVAGQVGHLFGRLAAHYGEDFIFMDVESISEPAVRSVIRTGSRTATSCSGHRPRL
jgi:hypothetical protein